MSLAERIAEVLEKSGLTQADLARVTQSTNAAVSLWMNGQTKTLKADKALAIANKTGFAHDWLITGSGPKHYKMTGEPGSYSKGELTNSPDEICIPQFNTGGSMGGGLVLRDQPGVIRGWNVNQEWVHKNVKNHSAASNLCIVTGFGDSMKGMFNSGDPLIVDRGVITVDYDAVYFFRVGNEGFIKRLQRIPGEGIRAISANKEYESWTIKPDMDFEVFGRVLKAWQGEDF